MSDGSSFSERFGHAELRVGLQLDDLDLPTRNRLWNLTEQKHLTFLRYTPASDNEMLCKLYDSLLKRPISDLRVTPQKFMRTFQKEFLYEWPWHQCLSLIEFIVRFHKNTIHVKAYNMILQEEGVGYQIVGFSLVPMTEPEQIATIENTLTTSLVSQHAKRHIQKALELMRPHGPLSPEDIVRESIHAVEAQAKVICGDSKLTLGKALDEINEKHALHSAFRDGFTKLYGFTSDASGVRHANKDFEKSVDVDDARFFLIACSAFVSWLAAKNAQVS